MNFYRFRSMDGLLRRHKELENQSIYFASPEQLNDPMEGYRDFFWSGDRIAWSNLFRHYLLCLDSACKLLMIAGESYAELSIDHLPLFSGRNDFPSEKYRERFREVKNDFFGRESIKNLIDGIVSTGRAVRRDELQFYLMHAHIVALESIGKVSEAHGLMPRRDKTPSPVMSLMTKSEGVDYFKLRSELSLDEVAIEALFQVCTLMQTQLDLLNRYAGTVDPTARNKNFVLLEFQAKYLKAIERLAFPDWYTACFMSECRNSSVWGHYGVNHTGVCLIFESREVDGRHYLPLTGYNSVTGTGPMKGRMQLQFHPVAYAEGYSRIDFFRSLGRLSMPALNSTWYSDEAGNMSECAQELLADEDAWRKGYWTNFLGDILRKTKDWSYELEYRLVLYGSIVDYSDSSFRTLNYEFSSLKGLIFGINAKTEDKLEVMRIIAGKCAQHKRTDFKFYQAFYSPKTKSIEHAPLSMLKLT